MANQLITSNKYTLGLVANASNTFYFVGEKAIEGLGTCLYLEAVDIDNINDVSFSPQMAIPEHGPQQGTILKWSETFKFKWTETPKLGKGGHWVTTGYSIDELRVVEM